MPFEVALLLDKLLGQVLFRMIHREAVVIGQRPQTTISSIQVQLELLAIEPVKFDSTPVEWPKLTLRQGGRRELCFLLSGLAPSPMSCDARNEAERDREIYREREKKGKGDAKNRV